MRQVMPKTTRGWWSLLCLLLCWPALLPAAEEKIPLRVGYLPILDHLPLLVFHARPRAGETPALPGRDSARG